ncbi:MAG: polysaccharide deacetylase family protein [Puniceicoccales bacterium]
MWKIMNYKKLLKLVLGGLLFVASVEAGNNGPEQLDRIEKPGVILTFDDRGNIPRWVDQIPLFEKYGVHATFCIERPDMLTPEQVEGLEELMDAGHEVASHGFRHVRGVDMVKENGVQYWVDHEVLSATEYLEMNDIEPTAFAYPNSSNNAEMDRAIQPYFRHVRTGTGIPRGKRLSDVDALFTPMDEIQNRFVLVGKGIDRADEAWLNYHLVPALKRVKANNEILMLYAHDITDYSERHYINPEILELFLQKINEMDLECYTMSELPSIYPRD